MSGFKLSILVLVSVFLSSSFTWSDQVLLKNGDRVTGSVIKKDEKSLVIKTDALGAVTAPWDQVTGLTVESPVYVLLTNGMSYQGTLKTAEAKVELLSGQETITCALAEIAAIRNADEQKAYERLLKPGWGDLWAGTGTVGLAGTTGNSETLTFTVAINAARATRTDKTSLYFSAIKASALTSGENQETARAVRGGISYNHNINNPRLFFNVFNDDEYDRFQDLDFRFVIGGGLGFHAVKDAKSSLDLLAGGDFNHSKFSTPLTRDDGEFFWGDEYSLQLSASTSLMQSFRMFNNLSETGIYRVNFDVGLAMKLSKRVTWNLALSDRYLSDPAPGRKTNDFLYTTGVGITFAK